MAATFAVMPTEYFLLSILICWTFQLPDFPHPNECRSKQHCKENSVCFSAVSSEESPEGELLEAVDPDC